MDYRGYIDVTALDLRKMVAAAFDKSQPQGLGFLHHKAEPLSEAELDQLIGGMRATTDGEREALSLDYVRGRSMKFIVLGEGGKRYWRLGWYDHTFDQQYAVLVEAGMSEAEARAAVEKAEAEEAEKAAEYARVKK